MTLAVSLVGMVAVAAFTFGSPLAPSASGPAELAAEQVAAAHLDSDDELVIRTFNEDYPEPLATHTLQTYGVDAVVEPHRVTHFEVGYSSLRQNHTYEWTLTDANTATVETFAGPVFLYQFDAEHIGQTYTLDVVEINDHGAKTRMQSMSSVVVKYVRREIRKITTADRERLLEAMHTMYTTPLVEGRRKYGHNFVSHGYIASIHNSDTFGYHGGDVFLTSHPAFQLMMENSLRAIDPNISSSPYWDFMLDAELYGDRWLHDSPVYKDDWFGTVNTTKENDWQVTEGRWAYTRMITHGPTYPFAEAQYNSYGLMHAPCDNTESPYMQRSSKFCGMETKQIPNKVETMVHCFFNNTDLTDFSTCLEINVHGNLHAFHGGAWDCAQDFTELMEREPDLFPEKVLQFFSPQLFNLWFSWGLDDNTDGLYSCTQRDMAEWPCARAEDSFAENDACAIPVPLVNVSDLTDSEVWSDWGNLFLFHLSLSYHGGGFIETIDNTTEHRELYHENAEYRWKHLEPSDQTRFTRWLVDFSSKPGKIGVASTGASPSDPLFWLWHPIFDRMLHILRSDPTFDYYDLSWTCDTSSCDTGNNGRHWTDDLPFENLFTSGVKGTHYTNEAMWGLLDPKNGHLPYIYDDLTAWGGQYWNPKNRAADARANSKTEG